MKRPYKIIWDTGSQGHNPRTLAFATVAAAIKEWESLDPKTSKPWAEVRGPNGKIRPITPLDFKLVFDRYCDETMICSTAHHMSKAKAYPELIEMGEDIVPYLIEALEGEEWGISTQLLLHVITGADPSKDAREPVADGLWSIDVRKSAEHWILWANERA